jgi:hypothetical protein
MDRGKEAILPPPYRDHPQIIPVIAHVADLISSVATGVTIHLEVPLGVVNGRVNAPKDCIISN